MTALERLRQAVELLPAGAAITLSREALLDVLGDGTSSVAAPAPELLTVGQLAELLHRSPSTVRAWCAAGQLDGAVRIHGRAWLVPRDAVAGFLERERCGPPVADPLPRGRGSLGDWRRVRRAAR